MAKARILIVEDEGIVAEDIRQTLDKLGYSVPAIAFSGEAAVKKAEELRPDLVLMDIVLREDMDGTEAAEQIRARFNIPVVYLTAYSNDKTLERAKMTGPFGYILKPFQERELHSTIEVALEKHRIEGELRESEEHYRELFQNISDIVLLHDTEGKILDANNTICQALGYTREEILSLTIQDIVSPEAAGLVEHRIGHTLESGHSTFNTEYSARDGHKIAAEVNERLCTKEGQKTILSVARDTTERKKAEEQLQRSFVDLAATVSRAISSRDPYTASHQQRVAELARLVGQKMGLDEDRLKGLYIGGLLHDIGKIAIPLAILAKPGKLIQEEWNLVHAHAKQGYQILKDTKLPWPVADMALHHHERLDGSGYPHGISGDKLTMEVRILGVCDVVEAMSSHHPYRPARSKEEVLEELKNGRGTKYDADVVDVMLQIIENGQLQFSN